MNTRRGLFRVWIVASVVWGLACGTGWYASTYNDWGKLEVARGCNTPDPSVAGTPKALEARNNKPWCDYIGLFDDLRLEDTIRRKAEIFGLASVLLPTSALALGVAVAWARRGFRSG